LLFAYLDEDSDSVDCLRHMGWRVSQRGYEWHEIRMRQAISWFFGGGGVTALVAWLLSVP